MPWEKQKELQAEPIPSLKDIEAFAEAIHNERSRALFCLTYLTAGRISEVLSLQKNQLKVIQNQDQEVLLVENMLNEKNPQKHFKDLPILISENQLLCSYILSFVAKVQTNKIFIFGRRRAEQLLDEAIGMNPHFIRHIRLTHLAKHKRFDPIKLQRFAGWSGVKQLSRYMEYRWEDLI